MRLARLPVALAVALLLAGALVAAPRRAAAEEPRGMQRLTLDRVEAEPSIVHGMVRMRLFVSAIDLATGGSYIPVAGKKTWTIEGAGGLKKVPYVAGLYEGADTETAIVFVLQLSSEFEADLESIKQGLREDVLPALPPRTQVAFIGYATDVVVGKLTSPKQAEDQLAKLSADPSVGEAPSLLRALDRAIGALKRAKPTVEGVAPKAMRKIIVLVSDGRDAADDRGKVTRTGKTADKAGIRIHTIAYSSNDDRRPLMSLGELAKQSQGTFRWVKEKVDDQSLRRPFKKLSEEIGKQYVLTYLVPAADVPAGKIKIATTLVDKELISLGTDVPAPACGDSECKGDQYCAVTRCVGRAQEEGRGVTGWVLLIGGIGLGAIAVLALVGFVITKLRDRQGAAPVHPAAAAASAAAAAARAAAAGAPPAPAAGPPPAAPPPPGTGAIQPLTAGYRPPAAQPQLIVLSGPQTGQRLPLRHGYQIGKAPDCDLSLAHDGFASGHHAQILMDAMGNCTLVDQGSTNGTFVNGVRVTETRLSDGMSVRCGSTELRFLSP